jgi:tRNA(Ile)-lysidine synthase
MSAPRRSSFAPPVRAARRWREAAAALAQVFPAARLHPAVVAWAAHAPGRQPWAVAFSGGADSLTLLLLLWALWPERRARLTALHFNHRLRGRASAADERFCREVCLALGVAYVSGRWLQPVSSEGEARRARLAFFDAELRRRRATVLWLGHQRDDIAESMLMRLARGSGTAGLAAPRPVQPIGPRRVHLRPLLTLAKAELTAALRGHGIAWREDATNARPLFLRNRMRGQVLPAWRHAVEDRDALAGAALARELLDEDDAALNAWADQFPLRRGRLALGRLRQAPAAVVRRVLHRWLAAHGAAGMLSRQAFAALLSDVRSGRITWHSLGIGQFVELRATVLALRTRDGKCPR